MDKPKVYIWHQDPPRDEATIEDGEPDQPKLAPPPFPILKDSIITTEWDDLVKWGMELPRAKVIVRGGMRYAAQIISWTEVRDALIVRVTKSEPEYLPWPYLDRNPFFGFYVDVPIDEVYLSHGNGIEDLLIGMYEDQRKLWAEYLKEKEDAK